MEAGGACASPSERCSVDLGSQGTIARPRPVVRAASLEHVGYDEWKLLSECAS
jgi:hypothetical protein